nr:HEPN domain-containing protein [uncultured Flavobacterium sp.]
MEEDIVFKGEWFLPDNLDNKIKGILTFKPNEKYSLLELFGSFYEFENTDNIDFILGTTFDGTEITLHKCYIRNLRGVPKNPEQRFKMRNLSGQQSSSYALEFIIKGAHIKNQDELSFNEILSEIFNLDGWLGVHGFSNIDINFEKDDSLNLNLIYSEPTPIEFKINDNLSGAFRFNVTKSPTSQFQKEYSVKQTTYLTLLSRTSLSLTDCIHSLFKFQNFLVTSLYTDINPSNIELICDKVFDSVRTGETEYIQINKRVKLYYSQRKKITNKIEKTHFEMLFTYNDIKEVFPSIIANWFAKYEILNPAFNLVFFHFYMNEKIIDVFFLNLAQAAESFHLLLNIKNKHSRILPRTEFKMKQKKIEDSLNDDDLYKWVNMQLNNKLNLEMRLRELINKYSIPTVLNFIGNTEIFIKQVKNTRNYLTHFDPDGKENALQGDDLVGLYIKLQRFLIGAILIEVGFDKELLNKLFINKSSRVFN